MAAELTIESVQDMTRAVDKMSTAFRSLKNSIGSIKGTNTLKELQNIAQGVTALDASLKSAQQAITHSLATVVATLNTLPADIADALHASRITVTQQGVQIGKAMGQSVASGVNASAGTVRASIKALQAEYEALAAKGQLKIPALQEAKSAGVSLFPADRLRLKEYEDTQRTLNAQLASVMRSDTQLQQALKRMEERTQQLTAAESQRMNASLSAGAQMVRTIRQNTAEELAARAEQEAALQAALKAMEERSAAEAAAQARYRATSLDNGKKAARIIRANLAEEATARAEEEAVLQNALRAMAERSAEETALRARYRATSLDNGKKQVAVILSNLKEENAALAAQNAAREKQLAVDRAFARAQEVEAARIAKQQAASVAAQNLSRARSIVSLASNNADGAYSVFAPSTKQHGDLVNYNRELTKFTANANDAHSAVRGLASGFGAMWLTWGNLVPLLAGAALSNGFVQTVKLGVQLQQTFETLRVLGGESAESVAGLQAQLIGLTKTGTPFALTEISDAMKTLTLAGLNAGEVGASIKDVLNFAIGGDTSITKAADVLTSAATAFGYTAQQYNIVGDVISKAAAISKASVDDMGEAFKTASVLNKQYGASLEDVGLGLSLLSNLGIKGSAAGTALRNMYVDLSGRTKEVSKTLHKLGIDVTDGNGKFVDFVTVVQRVQEGLDRLASDSDKARARLVLFSERGSKPIIEALDQLQAKAKASGNTFANELERMRGELANSAGFQTDAAVQLSVTASNQLKGVFSTMQASAYAAFQNIEPYIFKLAQDLKTVFSSEGFQNILSNTVKLVGALTTALAENLGVITALAAAYAAFKVGAMIAGGFSALAVSLSAATASGAALTTMLPRLTTALGTLFTFMGGPWGIAIGTVVAGLTALYFWLNKTQEVNPGTAKTEALVDAYKREADAIWDKVAALKANISLEDYQRQKQAQAAADAGQQGLADVQERIAKAERLAALSKNSPDRAVRYMQEADALKAQLAIQQKQLATLNAQVDAEKARLKEGSAYFAQLVAEQRKLQDKERKDKSTFGTGTMPAVDATKPVADNLLSALKSQYEKLEAEQKNSSDRALRILEAQHKAGTIDEGQYQADLLSLTISGEEKRLSVLNEYASKAQAAYEKARAQMAATMTGEQLTSSLANLNNTKKTVDISINADKAEVVAAGLERVQKAAIASQGQIKQLEKDSSKFWASMETRKDSKDRITQLAESLSSIKDIQDTFKKGYSDAFGPFEKRLESLSATATIAAASASALQAAVDKRKEEGKDPSKELNDRLEEAKTYSAALQAEMDKINQKGNTLATNAGLKAILGKDIQASLGEGVAKGFDAASSALAGFVNNLEKLAKIQAEVAAKEAANNKLNGEDSIAYAKEKAKIIEEGSRLQINSYGNIASAAKSFFKEGSKGYKAMETAEKAFRAVEMAMSLKSTAKQLSDWAMLIAAKVFGYQTTATTAATSGATEVAAAAASAQANAVAGVANQAKGDPYTAFGRMAAMAAIMAGLGLIVGGFGGGGGKQESNQGTGTVLGDSTAKSESISKAISKLSDNSDIGLQYSQGMLRSLTNIEANISGLASLVVRGTNTSGNNVATGTSLPSYITNPGISWVLGGIYGLGVTLASQLPVIGKLVTSLFGTKTSVTGQGLYLGDTKLGQAATGNLDLKNYTDIYKTKKFFGVTYSKSSSTQFSEADSSLEAQFAKIFASFYDAIGNAAGPLGANLDAVKNTLNNYVIKIGKIDLKGLTGDQIQEKLTAVFGAAADGIAKAALPGFEAFQKVGEGYFETVTRVANAVESATQTLNGLGVSVVNFQTIANKTGDVEAEIIRASLLTFEGAVNGVSTGVYKIIENLSGSADDIVNVYKALSQLRDGLAAAGKNIRDLSVDMINGAGGAEALQDGLSSYYDNFLTASEKAAFLTQSLSKSFGNLGLALPDGADGFKNLVKSIDTSTAAGQKLFGQVITLAGSFADLQSVLKDAAETTNAVATQRADLEKQLADAQDAYNQATMTSAQYIALQRAAIDDSNKALFDQIQAVKAATAAYNERKTLQSQLDELTLSSAELLQKQRDALYESNRALFDQIQAAKTAKAIADERKGLQDQLDELTMSSTQLLQKQRDALYEVNRTLFDQIQAAKEAKAAADERQTLQDRLDEATMTEAQLLAKQRDALYDSNKALFDQVVAAEAAKKAAEELANAWQSAADSIVDEIKRIRGLLDTPQTSFAKAQADFSIASAQARAGDTTAANSLAGLSQTLLDAAAKQATSSQDLARIQGQTLASLQATLDYIASQPGVKVPAFASGGMFAGGMRLVGENGPELEVTGPSRIYTADQTSAMMSGGDNAALAQEVAELKELVRTLIADNRAIGGAVVANTGKVAKILRDVTPDRDTIQVSAPDPLKTTNTP